MSGRTKRAIKTVEAALLLGILGDGLLRATPWGLNVLLWTGALAVALMILLGKRRKSVLSSGGHWLLLSAILFAAAFAWRDSATLNLLAGVGLLVSLALLLWRGRGGRLWPAGIAEYVLGILVAGVNAFLVGFPLLFFEVRWREIPVAGWSRRLKPVLRGTAIALPLLFLFGSLLVAADASFERAVNRLFFADYDELFVHALLIFITAWVAGGYLRGLLFGWEAKVQEGRVTLAPPDQTESNVIETSDKDSPALQSKPKQISLGIGEIGTALGLLNLLFLAFVLTQLRYLFGGASFLRGAGAMTYSEYYRRGFFELVWVAALVLPLLMIAHWLLRKDNPLHERIFSLLAGTQIILLFVIMASAVRRMLLYQREYGLTELRLYTTAFIIWLALVFVWFAATALRGRRQQFACGALLAGLLIIGALHIINPDDLIVRVNVAQTRAGRGFDAHYALSLSDDATPALLDALPALNVDCQRVIAGRLLNSWPLPSGNDWRTWNWSRAQSRRAVRERLDELREITAGASVERAGASPPSSPER